MEFVGKRSGNYFPKRQFGLEMDRTGATRKRFDTKRFRGVERVSNRNRAPGIKYGGKLKPGLQNMIKRGPDMQSMNQHNSEKFDYMHLLGNMRANGYMF